MKINSKYILFVFIGLFLSFNAQSNEETKCKEKINKLWPSLFSYLPEGGTPGYGASGVIAKQVIQGRLSSCIKNNKCKMHESITVFPKFFVDETMLNLQKKKIKKIESFFKIGESKNNCYLVKEFPSLIQSLEKINKSQNKRFTELADKEKWPKI